MHFNLLPLNKKEEKVHILKGNISVAETSIYRYNVALLYLVMFNETEKYTRPMIFMNLSTIR